MSKAETTWHFNFGPIARTQAAGTDDTFNLASLPLHVTLGALLASTSRDEFVEWLWHDLFKPAFYFPRRWHHTPGRGAFQRGWQQFAVATNTSGSCVLTHHGGKGSRFKVAENSVLSDQVEQVNLGRDARFVQLTFATEPSLTTALVRSVVADAFIAVVTRSVAQALKKVLANKTPTFERVRFRFDVASGLDFSCPPAEDEIWDQVGKHYDVCPRGKCAVKVKTQF